jgi:hypothetical protein
MITARTATRLRRGITLVDMMVAMAISLLIMLILSETMKTATDMVRTANAHATLMNQLSGAGTLLDHDLSNDHFLFEPAKPNGGTKLSDQLAQKPGWTNPKGGFFYIFSPQPSYGPSPTYPEFDREGIALSTATNHALYFTSIMKNNSDADRFLGISPAGSAGIYKSAAAEVAWFLVPQGDFTSGGPGKLPLYKLVRRYRLVALDADSRGALQQAVTNDTVPPPTHQEVISVPAPGGQVNTLADLITPANRLFPTGLTFGGTAAAAGGTLAGARVGEDTVLTNVLSFEVLVWWDGAAGVTGPRGYGQLGALPAGSRAIPNTEAPYDFLYPMPNNVYDSSTPVGVAAPTPLMRVRGLQITIRVADPRTGNARQNTIRVAM